MSAVAMATKTNICQFFLKKFSAFSDTNSSGNKFVRKKKFQIMQIYSLDLLISLKPNEFFFKIKNKCKNR